MSASDHSGRAELLRIFLRHEVKFVVIGGAAIQSHGRAYDTQDIDLTPDRDETNLLRLAAALNELECRLVTDPLDPSGWVALPADYFTPRSLSAASVWNLATPQGLLDLSFTPSGFPRGYADLANRAKSMPAAGTSISVLIASLDDVHASKRAADRPKDRAYFEASEEPEVWRSWRGAQASRRFAAALPDPARLWASSSGEGRT